MCKFLAFIDAKSFRRIAIRCYDVLLQHKNSTNKKLRSNKKLSKFLFVVVILEHSFTLAFIFVNNDGKNSLRYFKMRKWIAKQRICFDLGFPFFPSIRIRLLFSLWPYFCCCFAKEYNWREGRRKDRRRREVEEMTRDILHRRRTMTRN